MTIHLFDDHSWEDLLPLTYTRPVSELRCGMLTVRERAEKIFGASPVYHLSQDYLAELYPAGPSGETLYINGKWILSENDLARLRNLELGQGLIQGENILAIRSERSAQNYPELQALADDMEMSPCTDELLLIQHPWDIFTYNAAAIESDWKWLTEDRRSQPLPESNTLIGESAELFIEEGAVVEAAILNTDTGKIYISAEAQVMENAALRGPIFMGTGAVVKMAAKIYGATTIGPHSKVGGELSNVVINGYSNKGHDGFLGNSVIGEWCNFGADTNNSNLKNNYDEVKLWSEKEGRFTKTGLQFCGLIMGDHSKCGINTMFNTGTSVGVSCNIYGSGFPRNYISSFSWGGAQGFMEYRLDKAYDTMLRVMKRRGIVPDDAYKKMINHIFEQTKNQRKFK